MKLVTCFFALAPASASTVALAQAGSIGGSSGHEQRLCNRHKQSGGRQPVGSNSTTGMNSGTTGANTGSPMNANPGVNANPGTNANPGVNPNATGSLQNTNPPGCPSSSTTGTSRNPC